MKTNNTFFGSFSQDEDDEDKKDPIIVDPDDKDPEGLELDDDKDPTADKQDPDVDPDLSDPDTKDQDDEDRDFFATIIEEQAAKGLLFYDEDKEYEGTGEEIFDEVITDTLNKRWEDEYVAAIPEEYQSLFTHLKLGKPLDEWVEAVKPTDYSKIDLEDEVNQKSLIEEHLALTGMDEDDIKDALQEYEDAGTLDKNSKKALKYLQKNEDKKVELYEKQLEEEEKELAETQKREFDKFKSEVLATEELGKRKLDKKERERLFDHITKPVNKRGESQFVINQKSREKQLQVAYLDMIGFDFSKIEKEATTKAASGLRAKLSKTTDINGKKGGSSGRVDVDSKNIGTWNPW